MDYRVYQDLVGSQAKVKLLHVIRSAQREVMICKKRADLLLSANSDETSNVQLNTDVEVRLVEVTEELVRVTPRPIHQVNVVRHDRDCKTIWVLMPCR